MLVAKKSQYDVSFYDRQRARQRVVAKRETNYRLANGKLKMFGAVLSCALMAIILIAHFTYVVDTNHKLERSKNELRALQDQGEHLKLELASLQSPERLEREALAIGLQYPGNEQLVILTAGVTGD